ncbi:BrnT family toxin [Anaerovibrio sp. JC8]|uniref:BrnT family toxin n=1 Tax=Anaerovibrio sp. JC8 TaxID=1240085 RepID=UPI000A10F3F0|nr:BrnT family toxin [Anaerovibrio sp. JC8]
MKFEWDEKKNKDNINKHGFSFQYAKKVFDDSERLESDCYFINGEYRYDVLGKVRDILFVVCTDRKGDTIRIISARRATKKEEAIYYGYSDYDV